MNIELSLFQCYEKACHLFWVTAKPGPKDNRLVSFWSRSIGENVVVQRNSPFLVFSTWSFIESQIRIYRKIEINTHIHDASLRYCSTKTSYIYIYIYISVSLVYMISYRNMIIEIRFSVHQTD